LVYAEIVDMSTIIPAGMPRGGGGNPGTGARSNAPPVRSPVIRPACEVGAGGAAAIRETDSQLSTQLAVDIVSVAR